jgi:hypothetical protein
MWNLERKGDMKMKGELLGLRRESKNWGGGIRKILEEGEYY